jgi:hypothetical protein
MKYHFLLLLLFLLSCHSNNGNNSITTNPATADVTQEASINPGKVYYWTGSINSKYPIFVWMILKDSMIRGQVVYTASKHPAAIDLVGYLKNNWISVSEYQKDGSVTGIYNFKKWGAFISGTWTTPKNDKQDSFMLSSKDTVLKNIDSNFSSSSIPGEYFYAYGKDTYTGSLDVKRITQDSISFEISCVTGPPGYNIAEVELDTIAQSGDQFIYKMPDSDSCFFRVRFFNNFAFIDYPKGVGDCAAQFGMGADIDGIFYKVK